MKMNKLIYKGKVKNKGRNPILIQLEGKGMCDKGDIILMQWDEFEGRQSIVFPKTILNDIIKHLKDPFVVDENNAEELMKESSLSALLEENE